MIGTYDHDGAAVPARTNGNGTRTEPPGNLSDWSIQHNRSGLLASEFYRLPCDHIAVVIGLPTNYVGTRTGYRNATPSRFRHNWNRGLMTTFDQREEGFEKKFAVDEELKFKAE